MDNVYGFPNGMRVRAWVIELLDSESFFKRDWDGAPTPSGNWRGLHNNPKVLQELGNEREVYPVLGAIPSWWSTEVVVRVFCLRIKNYRCPRRGQKW